MDIEELNEELAYYEKYTEELEGEICSLRGELEDLRDTIDEAASDAAAGTEVEMEDMIEGFKATLVYSLKLLQQEKNQEAAEVIWQQLFELGFFWPQPTIH